MINFNGKVTNRPYFILRQLFIASLIVLMCCLFVKIAYSEETESQKRYIKSIEDEIQRHHELEMAKAQIEVLARLEMAGASKINVSNGSYSSSQNKTKIKNTLTNKSTQKNTNK